MAAKKTTQYIRNLTPMPVNVRLGSRKDPYYVRLERRGMKGDVHAVPVDLTEHPAFLNSKGKLFELLTKVQVEKIEYLEPGIVRDPVFTTNRAEIVRPQDNVVQTAQIGDKHRLVKDDPLQAVRGNEGISISRAPVPGSIDNPVEAPLPAPAGIERVRSN